MDRNYMKKLLRTILSVFFLTAPLVCYGASDSSGTKYPEKPVILLIGYSAGGATDLGARILVPYLEKELGVPVSVINKPGADGWVSWTELAKASPDGYTIGMVNIPAFYGGYLNKQLNRKESMDSFKFIANHVTDWGVLVVKKGMFKDMQDFMEKAKTKELTVADVSLGGTKHLQIEDLKRKNPGYKLTSVHMKGWPDNYAGILGAHVDAASATCVDVAAQLQEGEMEVLCIFAPKRSELLPNIPTCEETGFGAVYQPSSRGFMVPKGVNEEVFAKIQTAFKKAIANPEQAEKLRKMGVAIDYMDGKQYDDFIKKNEETMKSFADLLGWNKKN
jgi:tripartite-type tricarboxylate transporter receptor subunit TctC